MLQIIFSDNDWPICLNWHPLNIPKPRPFLYLLSVWRWAEHSSHFTALLSGYVDTDLTPRAHVQADVNSRVERVALNYFDVTARVRLAHVVFTIAVVARLLTYLLDCCGQHGCCCCGGQPGQHPQSHLLPGQQLDRDPQSWAQPLKKFIRYRGISREMKLTVQQNKF